ncbi:N-acetyltransferase family protein [Bradyrhizobium sp. Arg314]
MIANDVGHVPMNCHGEAAELSDRIQELGSAAILAYDGDQHVGQLQFRKHLPGLRSREGIFSPDWWGDFADRRQNLPDRTLCIYCYHVGQLTDGEARDQRYQGRGLGAALLDHLVEWADANMFHAVVAKAVPANTAVMRFMGGQPENIYAAKDFIRIDRWVDRQMHGALVDRGLIAKDEDSESVATVGLYMRELSAGKGANQA